MRNFDELETRSADERAADLARQLPNLISCAKTSVPALDGLLPEDSDSIRSVEDLVRLPVLRKSELVRRQSENPPFGGFWALSLSDADYVFQSPGPIYEAGRIAHDWWRLGRFLFACGIGRGDIVQNCFSYHLTPGGIMFENGARAVGATVLPAGTGNTEIQVRAASDIGATAYAGTPDYLKIILEKSDEMKLELTRLRNAVLSGGALFSSLRQGYEDRGIACRQCYATAEIGNIAYETVAGEPMVVDEGVIVEIVTPGTGIPVEPGAVGEVVVTVLSEENPIIRLATGDLSSLVPGQSPCGRTNARISGWKGRADQTAKVKGMFVRPEQVADIVSRHPEVHSARIVVVRENEMDSMTVKLETESTDPSPYSLTVREILKLSGKIVLCRKGELPKDGKVIDDRRDYGDR
ncbi:MAG: phenylacetate--CoA ligase family protein [Albidovulum sp.]|nr:phenylacetate--CoA ligase family protein [Albidovulum sp.]